MFELLALFALLFVGGLCLVAFIAVKAVFHLIFCPIKILLLPFLLIGFVIKLAVLVAVAAIVIAVLIPLAILALLFAAPFILAAALT
jgi:hypothetical protein